MTNAVESCDDHTADHVVTVPIEGGGVRALPQERLDEGQSGGAARTCDLLSVSVPHHLDWKHGLVPKD